MPTAAKSKLTVALASWLAVLTLACATSFGQGSSDGAPPRNKPANPLNPLTAIDPFVGTFDGEGMAITLRKSTEGYQGEVRRGDLTFPFKATRRGELLAGSFEYEGETFEFFVMATNEGVTFNTPLKLKRRDGAAAAVIPAKPIEAVTPATTPPVAPPMVVTPPKDPVVVKPPVIAPPVVRPDPPVETFAHKADAGRSWAGFPKGTFAKFEDTVTAPGALPQTSHTLLWFAGVEGNKEIIQPYREESSRWTNVGSKLAWLSKTKSLEELEYRPVGKSTGTLQVDGVALPCTVTEYALDAQLDGKSVTYRLQLWTSPRVTLPAQVLKLNEDSVLLTPDTARLVTLGDDWQSIVDFKLTSLKHSHRIGASELQVAVFEGEDKYFTGKQVVESTTKRYISPQVPGGIALFNVDKRNQFNQTHSTKTAVTQFGLAPTEAALPRP